MRAVVVDAIGATPELRDLDDPPPTGEGESLVRVRAGVVGHLDVQIIRGEISLRPTVPIVPGAEGAGEILHSDRLAAGTPVRIRGGGAGVRRNGTWGELTVVRDSALTPLDDVDKLADQPDHWALAAAFFSPAATAWAALHDVAELQAGERVLVTGASGAVGSMAVQFAARHGCDVVAAIGSPEKREGMPGRAAVIAAEEWDDSRDEIGEIDVVVDCVGGEPLRRAIAATRPGGRVALVGYTAGTEITTPLNELILADVRLLPTNLLRRDAALAPRSNVWLNELLAGELTLAFERFALADFGAAIDALADRRRPGRIVLDPVQA